VCFAHVVCAGAYADLDVVTTALRSASNAVKNNNDNQARVQPCTAAEEAMEKAVIEALNEARLDSGMPAAGKWCC
jgi:hypothetical protein